METAFTDVPFTPHGHLGLVFYEAVYRLLLYLRHRVADSDKTLEDVFRDFPFLAGYFRELRSRLPDAISWSESAAWLRSNIQGWEQAAGAESLPLLALDRELGLSS